MSIALVVWVTLLLLGLLNLFVILPPDDSWGGPGDVLDPQYFSLLYGVGTTAMMLAFMVPVARRFGGFSSAVGRTVILLSLAFASWGLGNLTYVWFDTCNTYDGTIIGGIDCGATSKDPYPSVADVMYILFVPLAVGAMISFGKALAMSLRSWAVALGVGVVALLVNGYLALPETTIFGIAYGRSMLLYEGATSAEASIGIAYLTTEVIMISVAIAILWSARRAVGGMYVRPAVSMALAVVLLWIADFLYFWRDSRGIIAAVREPSEVFYAGAMFCGVLTIWLFARAHERAQMQMYLWFDDADPVGDGALSAEPGDW